MDRRKFITNVTRGSILTGLGLITGVLLLKEKGTESCEYNFICRNCNKLKGCELKEAINYKESKKINCLSALDM